MTRNPTLTVSGGSLMDRDGKKVSIRGVNLPLLDDWTFPGNDYLDAVLQTGCNAVRIQWYVRYVGGDRPAYSLDDLGGVLKRCVAANVIPIIMLADHTGDGDATRIGDLTKWWTSATTVALLQSYANCLILNLANELGFWRWADQPTAALNIYRESYAAAIKAIRAVGLVMPLMIDAPDCGTSLDAFLQVGLQLIAADPTSNVLLSVHSYWAGTDSRDYIQPCLLARLPIIFGEIANRQDGEKDGDYYNLDGTQGENPVVDGFTYQALLTQLVRDDVSWLAWSWGPDKCGPRQLSMDGSFANLTTYGRDVLQNTTYGLQHAERVVA